MFTLYCLLLFSALFPNVFVVDIWDLASIDIVKIVALVLVVVDMISSFNKKSNHAEGNGIKKNSWLRMMALWCLWALLSLFWSKYKLGTLQVGTVLCEGMLFIFYGIRLIKTKEQLTKVLNVLIVALGIHCVFCILELKFGIYLFAAYTERYAMRGYPVSTFYNTNNLAVYISLMVFILIIAYALAKNRSKKILCLVLAIVSIYINICTSSRGAVIACIVGFIVFFVLLLKNQKIALLSIASCLLLTLVYFINPQINSLVNDILDKTFTVDTQYVYGSDYYRINAYMNGIDFIKETNGLGVSPGNVEYWMERYGARYTNQIKPLHNWWLEIPVSSGLLVACFMLIVWFRYYRQLLGIYFTKNISKQQLIMVCATIVIGIVFCISSISPSSLYKDEWPWLLLAVFFFMGNFIKKDIEESLPIQSRKLQNQATETVCNE